MEPLTISTPTFFEPKPKMSPKLLFEPKPSLSPKMVLAYKAKQAAKDLVKCGGCGIKCVHKDDYGQYRRGYWCSRACAYHSGDFDEWRD